MLLTREPQPILRPFVKALWAMDQPASSGGMVAQRERVLPTGTMHLAIRLSNHPLSIFDDENSEVVRELGHAIVGGARDTYYVRDISGPTTSVGAQLLPGAAELLFGAPADELSGRHTQLRDLWGQAAVEARERLVECGSPGERLDLFESLLIARLPRVHGLHPAVAHALAHFTTSDDVRGVVKKSGYSHRRFIELFKRSVGLTPKLYCRVLRFQRVLEFVRAKTFTARADIALSAGYSDQPHFNRQFREFAGVTPREYDELAPEYSNHVPINNPPV